MFSVNLCQDLFVVVVDNLWFDDLRAGLKQEEEDRLNIVFSPDVIFCGCLGSKYQLTN